MVQCSFQSTGKQEACQFNKFLDADKLSIICLLFIFFKLDRHFLYDLEASLQTPKEFCPPPGRVRGV